MNLNLSTPALLFPAISLLFLAYTNRFLHLAALVRKLHNDALAGNAPCAHAQLDNLRKRIALIRWMQMLGVASLLGCTLSMAGLFFDLDNAGEILFGFSVLLMAGSLGVALRELWISGGALAVLLKQLDERS